MEDMRTIEALLPFGTDDPSSLPFYDLPDGRVVRTELMPHQVRLVYSPIFPD